MKVKMMQNKKGYQTSEFWVATIGSVAGILNQSGLFGFMLPIEALVTLASMPISYIMSRTYVKGSK
jgi:hypothetical protein